MFFTNKCISVISYLINFISRNVTFLRFMFLRITHFMKTAG